MALVQHPSALMLALSAAVSNLDPSVPAPKAELSQSLEQNAEHWDAVASYAEAFPTALAKRVGAQLEEQFDVGVAGLGMRVKGEARDIRDTLGDSGA